MILTFISVAAASVAVACAWRMARDDRRRSEARIAALAMTIDGGPTGETVNIREPEDLSLRAFQAEASAFSTSAANARHSAGSMATPGLFDAARESAVQGHPLLKVAVVFGMAVALIVLIASMNDGRDTPTTSPTTSTRAEPSLELLSMRHVVQGDTLIVTGVVRNAASTAAEDTMPVLFAFDRGGKFMASGDGSLELDSLAPGAESSFRIDLRPVTDVGRYRVTFRNDAGVMRHRDRRAEQMAAAQ